MKTANSHEKRYIILSFFSFLFLVSCSSIETVHRDSGNSDSVEKKESQKPTVTENPEVKKVAELAEKSNQTQSAISHEVNETTKSEPVKPAASSEPVVTSAQVYKLPKGIDWATSLRWLKNGNTRFIKDWKRADSSGLKKLNQAFISSQPHAIIISDIDQRLVPHFIFDQQFGEIISYRSPGPRLSSADIVSMEYAIQKWGIRHIVVLGNSDCLFAKNCFENSKLVLAELKEKSEMLRNLTQMKDIMLSEAFLNLKNGIVLFK